MSRYPTDYQGGRIPNHGIWCFVIWLAGYRVTPVLYYKNRLKTNTSTRYLVFLDIGIGMIIVLQRLTLVILGMTTITLKIVNHG